MAANYKIISADSHVMEPPDMWQSRVPASLRDQMPRVVRTDEKDEWWVNDIFVIDVTGPFIQAAARNAVYEGKQFGKLNIKDWEEKTVGGRWEDVMPGAYDPKEFIKDQDLDGVYAAVVYPGLFLLLYSWPNSPALNASFKAYNEWLAEFCSYSPDRIVGVGLILLDDVEDSIKELRRCKEMGLKGAMIPCYPEPRYPYSHERYEPFWEAAEGLRMPLSLHVTAVRGQPSAGMLGPPSLVDPTVAEFVGHKNSLPGPVDFHATFDYYPKRAIGEMIFSGAFERHPDMMVVCVEFETGFVPHFLNRMDFTYKDYPDRLPMVEDGRFKNDMLPSDFWYKNVRLTFQEDPLGLQRLRDLIRPHTMMWGNDYPHRESTWPRSPAAIEETFAGVPEDEKEMIVSSNVAELYNIRL